MSITRRVRTAVPAVLAVVALAVPSMAGGASSKTCTESGQPHNNWSTTNTQTSACNSNSDTKSSPETATNPGGKTPAGQQP